MAFFIGKVYAEEYVIGVEEINYYPYFHMVDKEYQGFSRELFDAFAAKEGITFKYRPLPITRLYRELKEGGIDFKFPDNPFWGESEKKDAKFKYSSGVVGYIDGVLVSAANRDMAPNEFKSVGFVRGFDPWTLMPLVDKGVLKARKVNSWKSLIKLTLNEQVDGAYFNIAVGEYILDHHFEKKGALVFGESLPHDKTNYKVSTIKHKKLLQLLNKFLASDQAEDVRKKYGLEVYLEK